MRDMNNLKGQKNLESVYIYVFKKCVLNITQKQFLNRKKASILRVHTFIKFMSVRIKYI